MTKSVDQSAPAATRKGVSGQWLNSPAHGRWLEAETDRLLAFSRGSQHSDLGFAWLDDAGRAQLSRPVELWITCRMTHVFALGHLMGRPGCGPLVDHGMRALNGPFHDPDHGGWYPSIDGSGPRSTQKMAYEHAFVVLAAASASVAGRPGAATLLDRALEVLLTRFWDEEHGMVVEEWDRAWSTQDAYRGINSNMHTVEALLAAADATGDVVLLQHAQRIVTRVVHDLAPAHHWRIPEHFDAEWAPILDYNRNNPAHPFRPYGATIGHWLEWARLALNLRAALGQASATDWLLGDAVSLFEAAVREGWAIDGAPGFVYTVGWDGIPIVRERMHWVAAEAAATAATLHQVTGENMYEEWYQRWWDHIAEVFIDQEGGSWRHELDSRNRPSSLVWAGKPDTYHAIQATLIPRLPLSPSVAAAMLNGGLR